MKCKSARQIMDRDGLRNIDPADPIFKIPWIRHALLRDLLLFENQMPLCVLYELSEMVGDQRELFVKRAFLAFKNSSGGLPGLKFGDADLNLTVPNTEIKHLLGLMHYGLFLSNVIPTDEDDAHPQQPKWKQRLRNSLHCNWFDVGNGSMSNEASQKEADDMLRGPKSRHQLLGCFPNCIIGSCPPRVRKEGVSSEKFIPCVQYLREAGIKFENARRICNTDFQHGVIKIPTLQIADNTESLLRVRNLIAYEQVGTPRVVIDCMTKQNRSPELVCKVREFSPNFVADFVTFFDYLIDSENDVRLLRQCGVIDNWLGDDEVVAKMFNSLGDFVVVNFPKGKYSEIFRKVNSHRKRRRNVYMANLKHKYFNTPWAFISFLAALVLLFLALIQAVFTVLSFAIPHS